jgi:hypothetical protein
MSLDRRSFLFLGASAFADLAFGGYNPLNGYSVRTDGMDLGKTLKVKRLEIDIGIGRAFRVFHFSDTHLAFFDAADFAASKDKRCLERWKTFPQALPSFYESLAYAKERNLPLIHTGDLIDYATSGNETVLGRNVSEGDFLYAIGNHEYLELDERKYVQDEEQVRRRLRHRLPNDPTVASRIIGGVNFVAFDNARRNVRQEAIDGVKREFAKGLPVVLCCHCPPDYTPLFLENAARDIYRNHLRTTDEDLAFEEFKVKYKLPRPNPAGSDNERTRDFYSWLRANGQLKAILCGHTHIEEHGPFSETANMYVAGCNAHGFAYEVVFK